MKRVAMILLLGLIIALGGWLLLPVETARAATCTWEGDGGNNTWANGNNWDATCGGNPPTAADSVIIPDVAAPNLDPQISVNPVTITDLTIDAGGFLFVSSGGLTVNGSLVNNGTFAANVDVSFAGNLTNNNVFDANARVSFIGAANQSVSGSGGQTDFTTITINNTGATDDNIVEVSTAAFGVPAGGFLTTAPVSLVDGIFKLSGSFSMSSSVFTAGNYSIPAGTGFWLNNPNATVTALGGTAALLGTLRISQGTYNLGTAANHSLSFSGAAGTPAVMIMEGGIFNIAGRLKCSTQPQVIAFTMTGGTINIATVGHSENNFGAFDIGVSPSSSFTMSGGLITLANANGASTAPLDYRNLAGSQTITGGTFQFGTATTPASSTFRIGLAPDSAGGAHSLPNLVINSANSPTVVLQDPISVYGSITINSGATLSALGTFLGNANNITLSGDWTQDGTYNRGSNTNHAVTFSSAAQQTIGGAAVTTFNNLTLLSPAGGPLTLNIATVPYVNGALTLTKTNNRVILTQSQTVNNAAVQFLYITDSTAATVKYRGVDITTTNNLGTVAVTVVNRRNGTSDYCTSNTGDATTLRCFALTADNPSNSATVTLWALVTERNGIAYADLTPYHFVTGSGWQALTNLSSTTDGTYDGITGDTTGFSAFLLGGVITPTAITLRNLTAQSSASLLPLLAAALFLALISAGLWLYRQRKLARSVVNRRR